MSTRVLAVNSFWSLLSHLLWRGSLMLAAILLARTLSTSGFAAYSYFQMTATMLATYATLGLGVTASRFFAEAGHERPGQAPLPLGTLWAMSLVLSVLAFVVVALLPDGLVSAGLDVPQWMLALGVASIALGVIPGGAVLGAERYREASAVAAVSGFVMLAGSWWSGLQQAPLIAMVALIIGALIQAVGQFLVAGSATGWRRMGVGFGFARQNVAQVYGFAGPMMFVSLMAGSGAWIVGRLILHGADGEREFALYSIGMQWFSLTLLIPGMIARVLLPRMVRILSDAESGARHLVRRATRLAGGAGAIVGLAGVLMGPWLMGIYGSDYYAGRWFIAAYIGAAVVNAPLTTLGNAVVAGNGQWAWMRITAVWFVLLILLAAVGAAYGLAAWTGACAQSVSSLAQLSVTALYARRTGLV